MHIKHLHIQNVRSIRSLEMNFSEPAGWHVLIGDNGSGKSSILQAIALAIIGPDKMDALRLTPLKFITNSQKEASVLIKALLEHNRVAFKEKKLHNIGIKIKKTQSPNHFLPHLIGQITPLGKNIPMSTSNNQTRWLTASFGPFRRLKGENKDWEKLYYNAPKVAAHLTLFEEEVSLSTAINWLQYISITNNLEIGIEFPKTLYNLVTKYIKTFINQSSLLPFNTKIHTISPTDFSLIDGNEEIIHITALSDGFRSILSMVLEMLRQMIDIFGVEEVFKSVKKGEIRIDVPGLVMIDEIDAHLHPSWQTRIGEWFTTHFPNIQFIVTTHSPLICRACKKGSIWRLAAPGSPTQQGEITGLERERLIHGNILDAYGTGLFGKPSVRSAESEEKLRRLGQLNIRYAMGKISTEEEQERQNLQKILATDATIGF